jgi:hypothetical protein
VYVSCNEVHYSYSEVNYVWNCEMVVTANFMLFITYLYQNNCAIVTLFFAVVNKNKGRVAQSV